MQEPNAAPLPPAPPSFASRATALVRDVGDLARDHLELAVLEAQRAGVGLAKLLTAAVVVSVLVVTAWLALVGGGIAWATDNGVSWPIALLAAALSNVVLAGVVALWMRQQTSELLFSATLRQLRATASEAREAT